MASRIRQRLFSGFITVLVVTAALIGGGLFVYFLFNPTAGSAMQNLALAVAMFLAIAISCGWLVTRVPESILQSVDDLERRHVPASPSRDAPPRPALPEMPLPAEPSYTDEAIASRLQNVVAQGQGSNGDRLQFLDRVAHDLRAPLMAIQGYAVLMADPSFRMPHADFEKYGQNIAEQAGRMNRLIENAVT